MAELIFNRESPHLPQRGVITYDALDDPERELIKAVVNWQEPERHNGQFFEAFGRSILYRNPSPAHSVDDILGGNFAGLQIYGAGGSMIGLIRGEFEIPEQIPVNPVNPANHILQLAIVHQTRTINNRGQLVLTRTSYAPMHGMEATEANLRRANVLRLRNYMEQNRQNGTPLPFVVPELAAEGFFPDKVNPSGEPLRFQAYRVPVIHRFSQQLNEKIGSHVNLMDARQYLTGKAMLVGRTLRILHEDLGMAYINCHLGNMSYYEENPAALYITDLGGCKDITDETYKDKYCGMDFYMYLSSMKSVLTALTFQSEYDRLIQAVGSALTHGYFLPELENRYRNANILDSVVSNRSPRLIREFLKGPQQLMDFFHGYKTFFT